MTGGVKKSQAELLDSIKNQLGCNLLLIDLNNSNNPDKSDLKNPAIVQSDQNKAVQDQDKVGTEDLFPTNQWS